MATTAPIKIGSITEFHRLNELPPPEHPLISLVDYSKIPPPEQTKVQSLVFGYYTVSVKRGVGKMFYGQQSYDFDEGVMYCMAPGQVLRVQANSDPTTERSGWMLLIHPDFLWGTALARNIKRFEFFDYSVNEALFLSEKEETTLGQIVQNIRQEYHSNVDKFSQNIIISQIETLLNYTERFYQRQFITRKITNHQVLERLNDLLNDSFNDPDLVNKGLPTVQFLADSLNVSPGYLSSLLRSLTGMSAQQHIHERLIEKAKEKLSTTNLSVSEIAYELGFEHPQSFSKLFKAKTNVSPLEFRHSFN